MNKSELEQALKNPDVIDAIAKAVCEPVDSKVVIVSIFGVRYMVLDDNWAYDNDIIGSYNPNLTVKEQLK